MVELKLGTGLLCLFFTYYAMLQCSSNLPIMFKMMLKIYNCAYSIITISMQICMNKSQLITDNLERLFY